MIHRNKAWLTIAKLKAIISSTRLKGTPRS
jgi:hypothetical protein